MFVSGIPPWVKWQKLKDHFRVAGEVVYASVSEYADGRPKGVGIVQMETPAMAENAIKIMRAHPLEDGTALFVREDVQSMDKRASSASALAFSESSKPGDWECPQCANNNFARRVICHRCKKPKPPIELSAALARREAPPPQPPGPKPPPAALLELMTVPQLKERLRGAGLPVSGRKAELIDRLSAQLPTVASSNGGPASARETAPSASGREWVRCADDFHPASDDACALIDKYLSERDTLRQKGDFAAADSIRTALQKRGIKIDDRRKLWWLMPGVPASLAEEKGDGNWTKGAWKCTLPSEDGIDVATVRRLLAKRDRLREDRDFEAADELLTEITEMGIQFDDKRRTWGRKAQ